jgi:DNA polymerase-3 subunit epsilon
MQTRQIVLDTETTGLDPRRGHRVIEIGCVELCNRRLTGNHYQRYLQPDRKIDPEAMAVHGITDEFLVDKPRFADIEKEFVDFIHGAELLIHNAPFDVGFLNHELSLLGRERGTVEDFCRILDTLAMARQMHPGQRNTLDALCKRYQVDNAQRTLHGALLDAEILADVYLAMTGGQVALSLDTSTAQTGTETVCPGFEDVDRAALAVVGATPEELVTHRRYLELLDANSGGNCLWKKLDTNH